MTASAKLTISSGEERRTAKNSAFFEKRSKSGCARANAESTARWAPPRSRLGKLKRSRRAWVRVCAATSAISSFIMTPGQANGATVAPARRDMTMRLQNTLSRTLEELPPPPGPVGMYVCGPTVYQRIHIGNARPYVVSLWLKRWLEATGYQVKLVENITDVNDKIYDAAAKEGRPSAELAAEAARWYIEDTDRLGLGRPDVEPLATETIPEIVALIAELVERELAYESGGDVYFRVAKWPSYGELSGAKLDDMVAQEPSDLKEDQRDFALWKATKPNEDTSWDSPWGRGRPGWHIECSAMAEKHLGAAFDIHGGGLDLRFPHHENELAQSRGAGREFARIWAHNGLLQMDCGEDVEVGREHRVAQGRARPLGPRGRSASLSRRALPQPSRLLRRGDGRRAGAGGDVQELLRRARGRGRVESRVVPAGGDPRRRLQHARCPGAPA